MQVAKNIIIILYFTAHPPGTDSPLLILLTLGAIHEEEKKGLSVNTDE